MHGGEPVTCRELELGKVYVLRGLQRASGHAANGTLPPVVGRLERVVSRTLFVVKLRMGGWKRWAPKGRFVLIESFVREATAREVELGWPILERGRGKEAA